MVAKTTDQTAPVTEEVKEAPKVMNYGNFGGSKAVSGNPATTGPDEQPKTMNYGGFGKPREPASADRAMVKQSVFGGGSSFGAFKMPGSSAVVGKPTFNAIEQFKNSLANVLAAGVKPAEDYERIYRNSIPNANLPSMDYLKTKRPSVFHRAFESGQQAQQYVAPVHPKEAAQTERLLKLFTNSFLTKNLDLKEL